MNRVLEIATVSILGTLMFAPKLTTLFVLIWLVLYIIQIIRTKSKFKTNRALMILPVFYMIYVIGLFYTEDFAYANMDLGSKLSLVIFPIVYSFPLKFDLKFIAKGFVLACLASGIASIVDSILLYQSTPELGQSAFYGSYLGFKVHTTYLSWYYTTAIVFIAYYWMKKERLFNTITDIISVLFFLPFLYFLTSFAGLLLFVLIVGISILWLIAKKKGKKLALISVLGVMVLSIGVYFVPFINKEVDRGMSEFSEAFNNRTEYRLQNKSETESFKARALLWSVASELIVEEPMGFGTGDGKNTFVEKCKSYDLAVGHKGLNPHNQYFQTTLAVGAIGLVLLFGLILVLLQFAIEKRHFLLFVLVVGMAFHALFESILELQSGIVFFCLLTCIFINDTRTNWTDLKNG